MMMDHHRSPKRREPRWGSHRGSHEGLSRHDQGLACEAAWKNDALTQDQRKLFFTSSLRIAKMPMMPAGRPSKQHAPEQKGSIAKTHAAMARL